MQPKICDDSTVIRAVQAYIRTIRNAEKRRYADDYWSEIYNEAVRGTRGFPDTANYKIGHMAAQAVRQRINTLIQQHRTTY